VDSKKVTVGVTDGVATLTGTMDNQNERNAAFENVYQGGAQEVRDLLQVDGSAARR
jgi:osmotically-inducible protein OsmY